VEELGARVAHVLVGGRGQNEAGVIAPAADGRIRLDAARLAGQVVTVIGVDGRALRLTSSEAANYDDLSAVNIPAVEYPAGISGQGWDTVEERPVAPGRPSSDMTDTSWRCSRLRPMARSCLR
jgi:hypothetical protein